MWFKRSSRKIVVLLADTHGGHKLGLLNPDTVLFDEDEEGNPRPYSPRLTATQEWLEKCFDEDVDNVSRLADGSPIVVIHAGDATHGDTYPEQLVSTRMADQVEIAVSNARPLLELPHVQKVRFMMGTGAHGFGEGAAAILIASQLSKEYPRVDTAVRAHALFTVGKTDIDCVHKGPGPGIRNWTRGNQVRYYAKSVMADAMDNGEDPPSVIARAHFHEGIWETIRKETTRGSFVAEAFILPAYCGLSFHGREATQSKAYISCGLVALEIENGELVDCHPFWRVMDLRTREQL